MDENQRLIDANALEAVFKANHKMIIKMNGDEDCADTILWAIEKIREAPTVKTANEPTCSCGGYGVTHFMSDVHEPIN
jgi:hypothetical protein